MKIHWLQHVSFEGLGCIEPWLIEAGHEVVCTRLWNGEKLPDIGNVDGLIVMGGPMGVYDNDQYPWLADEKIFIKEAIEQNKPVLGICLGAQLIADVLGAEVRPAENKEIGFFPLIGNSGSEISKDWKTTTALHWHGDTFDIPDGAVHLAASESTENQAFVYHDNVLALQFHLETTEESLQSLYEHCADEVTGGPFIQTLEKMRLFFPTLENANVLICDLLKRLLKGL